MPPLVATGSPSTDITADQKRALLREAIAKLPAPPTRVLLVVPDFTRGYSDAGTLTPMLYELLSPTAHVDVLLALGTHRDMTPAEITAMYGSTIPLERFHNHDWRHGIVDCGTVSGDLVREWSGGKVDYDVQVQVNRMVVEGGYDLILSIGQIVPHEVVGMANYTKNIVVGVGGSDIINKSHFLGAVSNMEAIMGKVDSPVRRVFNYGCREFLGHLPIVYVMTVMAQDLKTHRNVMRGLYIGSEDDAFEMAARLSQQVNLNLLDRPMKRVVVYLAADKYKSTWLGNKAIYRTRLAIADDGELIILAPGLKEFGEDHKIEELIRRYGYKGTPATLAAVEREQEMRDNLSAAAHLIHGSSEGRFRITYAPGPNLSRAEIESVGYASADLDTLLQQYPVDSLQDGWNTDSDGEEFYYISNPALGLWALRDNFTL